MWLTNERTYLAAQLLLSLMRTEAPGLYYSFTTFNAAEASKREFGPPQWTPFISLLFVTERVIYEQLIMRAAQEFNLDENDIMVLPAIALDIAHGETVGRLPSWDTDK